ncbi:MAG TPA: nuclear transport factor 2 family protein [Chthoniobacterales bacterium]|nr:nuclear transport factor 2 family protein [Chthoniobacterales bacterium]
MNAGRIVFFGLTLLVASVAHAKYERAIDGKTKIWRDPAQQRMHLGWSGDRDKKGYATGKGTLTYYRTERNWETGSLLPQTRFIPVRKLKGKMVDGKLEGSVTTVSKGKTYRAKFEDGEKTTDWVAASDSSSKKKAAEAPAKPAAAVAEAKPSVELAPPAEAPPPAPKLDEHVAHAGPATPEPKKDTVVATNPSEAASPSADSLRSLAMPPSSLRVASLDHASPQPSVPSVEVSDTAAAGVATEEASTGAAPASSSVNDDDARAVSALDSEYHAAVKTNDAATIDRILADDFVMMRGGGQTLSKSDILKQARDKHAKYERHEIENGSQKIRVWRDTAVVTETLWVKGTEGGTPVDHKVSVTETYVRTPDGWRYVSGQASPSK